jgi:hypothetical protein
VKPAQTYAPAITWLYPRSTVRTETDMSAFDRPLFASRHTTVEAANPSAMSRTPALLISLVAVSIDALGKHLHRPFAFEALPVIDRIPLAVPEGDDCG